MNPPYGKSAKNGIVSGAGKSKVNEIMVKEHLGKGSANLYAQFIYKIILLKEQYNVDISLAFFCNPHYLTGSDFNKIKHRLLEHFTYKSGFMFNAKYFSNCSDNWGINFSCWIPQKSDSNINEFIHDIVEANDNGDIVVIGRKTLYSTDFNLGKWCKEPIRHLKTHETLNLSSGVNPKIDGSVCRGRNIDGSFGDFLNVGNNIQQAGQFTAICTGTFSSTNGCGILPSNFLRCTCAFVVRKLIQGNWINDKDEYLAPNETHPNFHRFEMDSVVYSLFHSSSQQSSLRNISYKGKSWDIPNEFFFLSRKEVAELANENNLDETYLQATTAKNEAFVYDFLTKHESELSPKAKEVLEAGRDLVRKSFKYRELFNMEHPEYQILNADAGWYQIKAMLKQYMPDELKKFRDLYKEFSEQLRPMVFELGFLRK